MALSPGPVEANDGVRTRGAWGILGGTFDPIHFGHLAIAEQTRETLQLQGVLFIPAGIPPHKPDRPISPARHRVAMVELAIADDPHFRLSRVEVDRPGVSFAVDTLELLCRQPDLAKAGLVVILSVEALAQLPAWRRPERILELAVLAVVPRRGYRSPGRSWLAEHFPGHHDRVVFLDGPDLGHSASEIRRRVSQGRTIRYLVPDAVAAYIKGHHLYPPELSRKT